jgi:hypothetical protein
MSQIPEHLRQRAEQARMRAASNGNHSPEPDIATSDLVERCYNYLGTTHNILWGRFFSVYEANGRRHAAEWLAKEIEAVLDTDPTPVDPVAR